MSGSWVVLKLILISSLPVIAVYIWFRAAKYQYSLVRFLFALLAGAAAFFPALIFQEFLAISFFPQGKAAMFYELFIRVAFTEEMSRLLMLSIFFWISGMITGKSPDTSDENHGQGITFSILRKATATGLIAGLGFSLLESARHAASGIDISLVLLRIITAALHGACGSRIGAAAVLFRTNPIQAILRIITATAIHGVYNMMIGLPGIPSIAAKLIALSALATAIMIIKDGQDQTETQEERE